MRSRVPLACAVSLVVACAGSALDSDLAIQAGGASAGGSCAGDSCAGDSSGGSSGGSSAGDSSGGNQAGIPEVAAFSTLTLVSSGGMPHHPPSSAAECGDGYQDTFVFDAVAGEVAWDYCELYASYTNSVVERGSRQLTAPESIAMTNMLAKLTVGDAHACGADKPVVTLDIETAGYTARYVDDFYACQPPPDGRTFIRNIDWLYAWLATLARYPGVPHTFTRLMLSGPPTSNPPADPSSECEQGGAYQYVNVYSIDALTAELTWDYCGADPGSSVYHVASGTRSLVDAEMASVLGALADVELGNSQLCGDSTDQPLTILTLEDAGGSMHCINEAEACRPDYGGGYAYVTNLEQLKDAVVALAR
jgi:hypothetical protein